MKKKFIFIGLALSMSIGCLSFKVLEQTIFQYKDNFCRDTATLLNLITKKDNYIDEETKKEIYKDVFTNAIDSVNEELPNYLDIIGLNVPEKNEILLENFNRNYVVPTFNQYAYSTFQSMQTKFNKEGRTQFNALASSNRKIASLKRNISTHFTNITNEDFKTLEVVTTPNSVNSSLSNLDTTGMSPTETIGALLASVGLAAGVAYTILAAASVLIATAPVAWCLPYSVPATIAALLTITGVILIYWEQISQIIWQLCDAFISCIQFLANQIVSFFEMVCNKAMESTLVDDGKSNHQEKAPGYLYDARYLIYFANGVALASIIAELIKKGSEYCAVLTYVKKDRFYIDYPLQKIDDVISLRLPWFGYSTYTLFETEARRIIVEGGTGITTHSPVYHPSKSIYGFVFYHFHNCIFNADGDIVQDETGDRSHAHSFFGLPVGFDLDFNEFKTMLNPW